MAPSRHMAMSEILIVFCLLLSYYFTFCHCSPAHFPLQCILLCLAANNSRDQYPHMQKTVPYTQTQYINWVHMPFAHSILCNAIDANNSCHHVDSFCCCTCPSFILSLDFLKAHGHCAPQWDTVLTVKFCRFLTFKERGAWHREVGACSWSSSRAWVVSALTVPHPAGSAAPGGAAEQGWTRMGKALAGVSDTVACHCTIANTPKAREWEHSLGQPLPEHCPPTQGRMKGNKANEWHRNLLLSPVITQHSKPAKCSFS